MGNIRALPWLKLAVSVAALVAVLAAAFLVVHSRNDGDDLDKYFLRDAKAMQEMGLPVYWLGREFTAGDLIFRGPYVDEFGAEVKGGGIDAQYLAPADGGNVRLSLTTYSGGAWELVESRMMSPLPSVTRKPVSVAGQNGDILLESTATRPLNAIWLVVRLSNVVVVAQTNSVGVVYSGGPDHNPFVNNPDLLVQVMQDLRPYPE